MPVSIVQHTVIEGEGGTSETLNFTLPADPTPGNLLVIVWRRSQDALGAPGIPPQGTGWVRPFLYSGRRTYSALLKVVVPGDGAAYSTTTEHKDTGAPVTGGRVTGILFEVAGAIADASSAFGGHVGHNGDGVTGSTHAIPQKAVTPGSMLFINSMPYSAATGLLWDDWESGVTFVASKFSTGTGRPALNQAYRVVEQETLAGPFIQSWNQTLPNDSGMFEILAADAGTPQPPAAIDDLDADALTQTSIQLTWTRTTGTAEHQVQQWNGSTFQTIATLPGTTETYTVTGLTAGTAYTFRVLSVNAEGSTASNSATESTLPPTVVKIAGVVTLSGNPVQGAVVRLFNITANTYVGSVTTTSGGSYEFDDLNQAAEYHVAVEYQAGASKYRAYSAPFTTAT
jgi:hypothetical protein